jgi:hypothetical protein
VNDFVALLIAVAAFLLAMMAGQALIVLLHGALDYSDTVIAFGPVLRLAVSAAIAFALYRRLYRGTPAQ